MKNFSAILLFTLTTSAFAGVMDQAPFKQGPVQDTKLPPVSKDQGLPQQDLLPPEPIAPFGLQQPDLQGKDQFQQGPAKDQVLPQQDLLPQEPIAPFGLQQPVLQGKDQFQQGPMPVKQPPVDKFQQGPSPLGSDLLPSCGPQFVPGVGYTDNCAPNDGLGVGYDPALPPAPIYDAPGYPVRYGRDHDRRFGRRLHDGRRFGRRHDYDRRRDYNDYY